MKDWSFRTKQKSNLLTNFSTYYVDSCFFVSYNFLSAIKSFKKFVKMRFYDISSSVQTCREQFKCQSSMLTNLSSKINSKISNKLQKVRHLQKGKFHEFWKMATGLKIIENLTRTYLFYPNNGRQFRAELVSFCKSLSSSHFDEFFSKFFLILKEIKKI